MKLINPNNLFSPEILNYQVETKKFGRTSYVNLDNAATTPPLLVVEEKLKEYLTSYGSVHRGAGVKSKISTDIYEESRQVIKKFVNAPDDWYVLFAGNTTGAMNMAAYFFSFVPGKVAVSAIEHSSSWLPWVKSEGVKWLGKERVPVAEVDALSEKIQKIGRQYVLQYDVNEKFEFDLGSIEELLRENRIKALVLTAASNLTGYCPDIKRIGQLAHKYGAYFIVDACQYLQHHKLDMQTLGIDFLAASGHKFYAPYGGGFLIGPKKFLDQFLPYQIGGGNLPYITEAGEFLRYKNQLAHDPGTPNAVGAVAMSAALTKLTEIGFDNIRTYEQALTKKVFDYLETNKNIELFVSAAHLNTVIPFRIKNRDSKEAAEVLNSAYGIGVRAGSFCVYDMIRKLTHENNEEEIITSVKNGGTSKIPGLIRASFALCNTEEDVKRFIESIKEMTTTINSSPL